MSYHHGGSEQLVSLCKVLTYVQFSCTAKKSSTILTTQISDVVESILQSRIEFVFWRLIGHQQQQSVTLLLEGLEHVNMCREAVPESWYHNYKGVVVNTLMVYCDSSS